MSSGDHFRKPIFLFFMYPCPSNSPHDSTWLSYENGHLDSFSRSVCQTKEVTVSLNVHTSLNYDFPLCCPEVPGFPCGWEFSSFFQREPGLNLGHHTWWQARFPIELSCWSSKSALWLDYSIYWYLNLSLIQLNLCLHFYLLLFKPMSRLFFCFFIALKLTEHFSSMTFWYF